MRKLYEKSSKMVAGCSTIKDEPFWRTGKYAAPCSYTSMQALISDDYTRTGKCNYYMTKDVMHHMNLAMAFQVFITTIVPIAKYWSYVVMSYVMLIAYICNFRREAHTFKM